MLTRDPAELYIGEQRGKTETGFISGREDGDGAELLPRLFVTKKGPGTESVQCGVMEQQLSGITLRPLQILQGKAIIL